MFFFNSSLGAMSGVTTALSLIISRLPVRIPFLRNDQVINHSQRVAYLWRYVYAAGIAFGTYLYHALWLGQGWSGVYGHQSALIESQDWQLALGAGALIGIGSCLADGCHTYSDNTRHPR